MTEVFFYSLSAIAIACSLLMLFQRNAMYSVLYLLVCFFAVAGLYIMLNAQFLAIVNLIVYAGAIMVLFLFVVMLMNLNSEAEPRKNQRLQMAGLIAGGSLLLVMIDVVRDASEMKGATALVKTGNIGLINNLGMVLFKDYVVPFEIASVLFLSDMVGAVVIGKKD